MDSKFVKTIIKGIFILIPILAVVLLFKQIYDLINPYVEKVMQRLGLSSHWEFLLALVVSLIIIIIIIYLVGAISRRSGVVEFAKKLDKQLLKSSDIYRIFKLKLDNSSGFLLEDRPPVFVNLGHCERPAFLIESQPKEGKAIVFIPKNFNDFNGNVYIVPIENVREAKQSKDDFVFAINHLGADLDISWKSLD